MSDSVTKLLSGYPNKIRVCQQIHRPVHRISCHETKMLLEYGAAHDRAFACQKWCEQYISPLACAPNTAKREAEDVVFVFRLDADAKYAYRLLDARYCSADATGALLDALLAEPSAARAFPDSCGGILAERRRLAGEIEQRAGTVPVVLIDVGGMGMWMCKESLDEVCFEI
ncbi:hypothetical protein BV25DRAFT_1900188 [Artomyces pyxidatus]|uniref:Uncharacterized protein n=1 Tax=Artomyces pyxidatus TaxID=48021 RepID=A0ACB8T136_9AGAM|nr:hypothetical protein BV25DRAFT_1900188 [Artomyces pyxidatus]